MIKVLVQSSVLFSAALSPAGGSRQILNLAQQKRIYTFNSQDIIDEVKEHLQEDYPEYLNQFEDFIQNYNLAIHPPLSQEDVLLFKEGYIQDKGDAHVVAVAAKLEIDFLISLDKKHFLQNIKLAKKLNIRIVSPGEFLQEMF